MTFVAEPDQCQGAQVKPSGFDDQGRWHGRSALSGSEKGDGTWSEVGDSTRGWLITYLQRGAYEFLRCPIFLGNYAIHMSSLM